MHVATCICMQGSRGLESTNVPTAQNVAWAIYMPWPGNPFPCFGILWVPT